MEDLGAVTAVILAGGRGTRLRGVVADRPKVVAPVGGRPFLTHLFDRLDAVGLREVVLCTGYLAQQIVALFGDSYRGLRLGYSREAAPLGTGGAIRLALCQTQSDPVLVLNGDSYCDVDIRDLWRSHHMHPAVATLTLVEVPDTGRYGRVHLDDGGRVVAFEEKGGVPGPGWINAGVYLLSRRFLAEIPAARPLSLEQEIFPAWAGRGLYGYPCGARLLDIGTPDAYAEADKFFGPREVPADLAPPARQPIQDALAGQAGVLGSPVKRP
jgi:D-glycero-alpha-D-manno-heptose 1-phosphate guanylyltransferase